MYMIWLYMTVIFRGYINIILYQYWHYIYKDRAYKIVVQIKLAMYLCTVYVQIYLYWNNNN